MKKLLFFASIESVTKSFQRVVIRNVLNDFNLQTFFDISFIGLYGLRVNTNFFYLFSLMQ